MDKALKLMPYDPAWPRDFDAERDRIAAVVGVSAVFPSSGVYGWEAGFPSSGSSSERSRRVIRTGYEAPSNKLTGGIMTHVIRLLRSRQRSY